MSAPAYGSWRKPVESDRKVEEPGKATTPLSGPSGKWSDSYRQATNPAAPMGASWADRYNAAPSQAWLTGQNVDGSENGFDTNFYNQFVAGYKDAEAKGEGADYFASKKTGVALWDDPNGRFRFGDTFINGEDYGNVYTQFGQEQGDLLMGRLVWGANIGRYKDPESLSAALRDFRVRAQADAKDAISQQQYEKLVDAKVATIDDWQVKMESAAQGALTWGGLGVTAGMLGTPVVAGIAGAAGAVGGGLAGWFGSEMNIDETKRRIAETRVQADLAAQRIGDSTGEDWLGSVLQGAKYGMAELSATGGTVTNLVHGLQEQNSGGVGDGRLPSADLAHGILGTAAGFADALSRSASLPAKAVFMTEMIGTGVTGASELIATGGQAFDYRAGTYRNVFKDRESGEVTAESVLRGAFYSTSPVIDVVQGVGLGGLGRALRARITPGRELTSGVKLGTEGGFRWGVNAEGKMTRHVGSSFFAPSEMLRGATAAAKARIKLQGKDFTRDQFKREMYAELRKQGGRAGLGVNALGEGFEEAYQAVAEQVGLGHDVDWDSVRESFIAGAVMGAGMHLGSQIDVARKGGSRQADFENRVAADNYRAIMGREMPDGVSNETRARFAALSPEQVSAAREQSQRLQDSLGAGAPEVMQEYVANIALANVRIADAQAQTAQEHTDTSGMITRLDSTVNPNNAEGSTEAVLEDYRNHAAGLQLQIDSVNRKQAAGTLTSQQRDEFVRIGVLAIRMLNSQIIPALERAEAARKDFQTGTVSRGQLRTEIDAANKVIASLWNAPRLRVKRGRALNYHTQAASLAASLIFHRAPKDQRGSMSAFRGLVNLDMSTANGGAGTGRMRRVGTAILTQKAGDYDGDLFKSSNQIILSPDTLRSMRSGPGRWQPTGTTVKQYTQAQLEAAQAELFGRANDGTLNPAMVAPSQTPVVDQVITAVRDNLGFSPELDQVEAFVIDPATGAERSFSPAEFERVVQDWAVSESSVRPVIKIHPTTETKAAEVGRLLSDAGAWPVAAPAVRNRLAALHVELSQMLLHNGVTVAQDQINKFITSLEQLQPGDPKTVAKFFDSLGSEHVMLKQISNERWTDIIGDISTSIERALDDTSRQYAAARHDARTTGGTANPAGAAPVLETKVENTPAESRQVQQHAATDTLTRSIEAWVADTFRDSSMTQYSLVSSPVWEAQRAFATLDAYRELVEAVRASQSGEFEPDSTTTQSGDRIIDGVLRDLQAAINQSGWQAGSMWESMLIAASMPVDAVGTSLIEVLFRASVAREVRQYVEVLGTDDDPAISALIRLAQSTRSEMLATVFNRGAGTHLKAEDAEAIGRPNMTMMQHARDIALDPDNAKIRFSVMKKHRAWGSASRSDSRKTRSVEEMREVSAYRIYAEAVMDIANHLHAKQEKSSKTYDKLAVRSIESLRDVLISANGSAGMPTTSARLQELLQQIPGGLEGYMRGMLTDTQLARLVVRQEDGSLMYSTWLLDALLMPTVEETVDKVWIHSLLDRISAVDPTRTVDDITDLMVRGILRMQNTPDAEPFMLQLEALIKTGTRYDIVEYLNRHFRNGAPAFTVWSNDIRNYDADATRGGWQTPESLADRMDHLRALERSMKTMATEAFKAELQSRAAAEGDVLSKMKAGDKPHRARYKKLLAHNAKYGTGLTWGQLVSTHVETLYGLPAGMSAKGADIASTEEIGKLTALAQSQMYGDTVEMGIWQAFSGWLGAIQNNPQMLAGVKKGTYFDDKGRMVKWHRPSMEEFAVLWEGADLSPASRETMRGFLQALLFSTYAQENQYGGLQYGYSTLSLAEVMKEGYLGDQLFGSMQLARKHDGLPVTGNTQTAALFSAINVRSNNKAHHFIEALLTAQTSGDTHRIESPDARSARVQGALRRAVQIWSALTTMPDSITIEGEQRPTVELLQEELAEERSNAYKERHAFGGAGGGEVVAHKLAELTAEANEEVTAASRAYKTTPNQVTKDRLDRAQYDVKRLTRLNKDFASGSVRDRIEARYGVPAGRITPEARDRMWDLWLHFPDIQSGLTNSERDALARLSKANGQGAQGMDDGLVRKISANAKAWAYEKLGAGGVLPGSHRVDPEHDVMGNLLDPEMAYLDEMLFDPDIVAAIRELRDSFDRESESLARVRYDEIKSAVRKLTGRDAFGDWTIDIARVTQQNMGWINASADPVKRSGSVVHRAAPLAAVTEFLWDRIDPAQHTTLDVDVNNLTGLDDTRLQGRFVAQFEVVDIDMQGNAISQGLIGLADDGLQPIHNNAVVDPALWAMDGQRFRSAYQRFLAATRNLPVPAAGSRRHLRVTYVPRTATTGESARDERNIFRRGINTTVDQVDADNNIGLFLMGVGGPGQAGTTAAFKTAKTGEAAIRTLFGDGAAKEEEIRDDTDPEQGGQNMSDYLDQLTTYMMGRTYGDQRLSPQWFTGLREYIAMHVVVRYTQPSQGGPDEARLISASLAERGLPADAKNVEVLRLPPEIVRSLVGARAPIGGLMPTPTADYDLMALPRFNGTYLISGLNPELEQELPGLLERDKKGLWVKPTDLLALNPSKGGLRTLAHPIMITPRYRVSGGEFLTPGQASRRTRYTERQQKELLKEHVERAKIAEEDVRHGKPSRYDESFDQGYREARLELYEDMVVEDEIAAMQMLFDEMPDMFAALAAATSYNSEVHRQQNTAVFEIVRHPEAGIPITDWRVVSSIAALEKQAKGRRLVANDIANMHLDQWVDANGDVAERDLHAMISSLVARGATFQLAHGTSNISVRLVAEASLRSQGYERIGEGLWVPARNGESYLNTRARMSQMTSRGYESAQNLTMIFYNDYFHDDENSARLIGHGLEQVQIAGFTEVIGGETRHYHYVDEQVSNSAAAVFKAEISELTKAELHAYVDDQLKAQRSVYDPNNETPAWGKAEHDGLFKALRAYAAQADVGFPTQQPRGTLIPLVDDRTGRILFVRSGMRMPRADELRTMMDNAEDFHVMFFPPVPDQGITSRDLVDTTYFRGIDGRMRVRGSIQISDTGKFIFEGTGHKVSLTPAREGTLFAEIIPGVPIRVSAGHPDALKTGGIKNTLDVAQNIIKFVGYDQATFITSVALGITPQEAASKAYASQRKTVIDGLHRLYGKAQQNTVSPEAVDQTIRSLAELARHDIDFYTEASEDVGLSMAQKPNESLAQFTAREEQFDLLMASIYRYWQLPGASFTDIMHSNPLGAEAVRNGEAGLWRMPALWTQLFDRLPKTSLLRKQFVDYINAQVALTQPGFQGRLSVEDFWWEEDVIDVDDAGRQHKITIRGVPAIVEMVSSGDDVIIQVAADDRKSRQGLTVQAQAYAASVWNSAEAMREMRDRTRADSSQAMFSGLDRNQDVVTQVFAKFDELTKVRGLGTTRLQTLAELQAHEAEADLLAAYSEPLRMDKLEEGYDKNLAEITEMRKRLETKLGLKGSERRIVDQMVRLAAHAPGTLRRAGQKSTDENANVIPGWKILGALRAISRNVERGDWPLAGMPVMSPPYDSVVILRNAAVRKGAGNWLRWDGGDQPVVALQDWVEIALGQPDRSGQRWNRAFLPSVDAVYNTFRAHEGLADLLSSVDEQRGEALLNIELEHILVSWDEAKREELSWMPVTGTQLTVGEILMARHNGTHWVSEMPDTAFTEQVLRELWAWQKDNRIPVSETTVSASTRERGRAGIVESKGARGLYAMAKDWRIGLALLTPGMLIASPAEFAQVRAHNNVASIWNGTSSGAVGWAIAKMREAVGVDTSVGGEMSTTDINVVNSVVARLGRDRGGRHRALFADEFKDDTSLTPMDLLHKVARRSARLGTRIQDPLLNRSYETYMRLYLEGLFDNIARDTSNNWTLEKITRAFERNPEFFKLQYEKAHERAMNRVRASKLANQTVLNKIFQYHLKKLETSDRILIRWPAQLTVGLASTFSRYAFARMEQIAGGQVIGLAIALHMHARKINKLAKGYDQVLSMITKTEMMPADALVWDMNDVLESLDLSEAFLRSGSTWVGYFMLTGILGQLGLDGTTPEDRRRRRQGKAAGNVHLYDPRDVANDFRNMDAIYLDSIPWLDDLYRMSITSGDGEARSPVHLNWIMRSLWSPVLGMTRFQESGNPYEILWGFQDAMRSMPLINTMFIWDMSDVTATLIEAHEDEGDGAEALDAGTQLAVRIVMNLERMLLESSFINQIYQASDKYDRDPYRIARRDEAGNIMHDRVGGVEATQAMQAYIDPVTGETRKAYLTRNDPWFIYAENRMTWAAIMLPFTGGESWRTNMVTKTRSIDKSTTIDDARAVVMDLFNKDYLSYDEQAAVVWGAWKGSVRLDSPALDGFYMSRETRLQLTDEFQKYLVEDGLALGLTEKQAIARANKLWWGDPQQPGAFTPFNDIVWSDQISRDPSIEYRQLNTTYVIGPDGRPWATGISRDVASTIANISGVLPWQGYNSGTFGGMNTDALLNSVDPVLDINTGMRALERIDESWSYTDQQPLLQQGGGQGYYPFSGYRSFGGGGGGGGGGYAPRASNGWIDRWYPPNAYLPNEIRTYAAPAPNVYSSTNINSGNPTIRRLSRRRERVQSQRGRLKPWQ